MNWDQAYPPSWAKEMDKPGSNTSALLSWHSLGVLSWRHSKKQALYIVRIDKPKSSCILPFSNPFLGCFYPAPLLQKVFPENHGKDEIHKNTMNIFDHFPIFLGQFTNCEYESIDKKSVTTNIDKKQVSATR